MTRPDLFRLSALPNLITIARATAGVFGAWAFVRGGALAAVGAEAQATNWVIVSGVVLVIAALSDFLDGWLARALRAASATGALLDPIADKILVGAYLVAFVIVYEFDPFLAAPVAVILARDIVVTWLRLRLLKRTSAPLPVTDAAKFKTGVQLILLALPFLLGLLGVEGWFYVWVGGVWFVALLAAWTGWPYLRATLRR